MSKEIKVALIGLDTSHTIEFARRIQAPDCPPDQKVSGLRATACLRFSTPFQNEDGLNTRQKQLEDWGIKVTTDFNDAVKGCDAIMLEINDASYHLEYFKKCATLGKPIFLDKPLADNIENGLEIVRLAKENKVNAISASSLRFDAGLIKACGEMPKPTLVSVYGPLGIAPAGSSIVWYGVHAFEMLEKAMGKGSACVTVRTDGPGVVAIVDYPDKKRGVVELTKDAWIYGGTLRDSETAISYSVAAGSLYANIMKEIEKFFRTGKASFNLEDTVEVMAMLDAAERSFKSGKTETVYR
ncbi:MAG: Gfo/Idh/MocA family oxidoreductase [Lentisphaerae bacterium]|nr:Gfo/Idh/MocA family oxidoreductase [Lentisphaerota bacterium]